MRYYSSVNASNKICYYVSVGSCWFEREQELGCTDYDGYVEILWFNIKIGVIVPIEDVPEYVMEVIRGRISDPFFVIDVRKRIEKLNVLELEFIDEVCL